jgi:molybdate transport system substrate-binding protein
MTPPPAKASGIRVYSGGAPQRILNVLFPEFERTTGHTVTPTFEIVSQVRERVVSGDHPDLILLPEQVLAEAAKVVRFRSEGAGALARVGIGVIVRDDATHPDLSDEAGVRSALRGARAIVLADPRTPSGRHLEALLAGLGLTEELRGRLIHKGAIHGGGDLVASGEADLGLFLVSEVQHIEGVRVAGLLPPALQQHVVYAAAIPASAQCPEAALSLIRFLTTPASMLHWKEGGFEPAEPA